jgi:predicted NBD/HSP70 family sugar kinase/biotin operon repressor
MLMMGPDTSELTRSAVLRLIAEVGAISRSAIADKLGLSRSTVTRVVRSLQEEGFIREGEAVGSKVGRKPILLELNPGHISFIGLDLSGPRMRGALADLRGDIVYGVQSEPLKVGDGRSNLRMLDDLIGNILQHARSREIEVSRIGAGVPATGLDTPNCSPIWAERLGWVDPQLRTRIRDRFGLKTFIENAANLAAISERWLGAGKGADDLVYLVVGQGIGGGIIIDGRLHRGSHSMAGEPATLVPDPACLRRDYAKTLGCLESLASEPVIVGKALEAIAAGEPSSLAKIATEKPETMCLEEVLKAADQGDDLASRLVDHLALYLAIAVINIASLLDPEVIIIGGYLGAAGEILLQRIRERAESAVRIMPDLRLSTLGDDVVLLGAIALAQQGEFSG